MSALIPIKNGQLTDTQAEEFRVWKRQYLFKTSKKLTWEAACQGKAAFLRHLLQTQRAGREAVLLQRALEERNITALKTLIDSGTDINTALGNETLLFKALNHGNNQATLFLIERGADLTVRTRLEDTLLHRAAELNNNQIVVALLNAGLDPDAVNDRGETALMKCRYEHDYSTAQLLLEGGANPLIQNDEHQTARHKAIRSKSSKLIALLEQYESRQETRSSEQPPPDNGGWEKVSSPEARLAIQTIHEPQSKLTIRHIFDFNAKVRFTQISHDGEAAGTSQSEKDFAALDPDCLKEAEAILHQTRQKSSPAPQNIKLT